MGGVGQVGGCRRDIHGGSFGRSAGSVWSRPMNLWARGGGRNDASRSTLAGNLVSCDHIGDGEDLVTKWVALLLLAMVGCGK